MSKLVKVKTNRRPNEVIEDIRRIASEFNFIKDAEVSELEKEIDELNRMIYKFCETLKTNR